ncbi:MAG TPA: acetyl-CoA carboxylase biotin carboxylase subunit [Anaerolineaceae bacterium]|nr:acetyl-CoA carboxylase biotin carboxylase subunit [Anaerolineaceae bacterium]
MKILVANRGEIAVRILRACQELGFPSVAIYSESDQVALHVRSADEAIAIGANQNYLNITALLDAAKQSGADAIHPGYGFLSENAVFAQAVEAAGFIFIGPRPETIALTGDKLAARHAAAEAGLPVLPGSEDPLPRKLPVDLAAQVNYPVLIKATAGGGGRGIRLARSQAELQEMISAARQEAKAAFGNDDVYLESLVQDARHIEVQIIGDGYGHILCLGERECSIQRRRQKLIEEAPASGLSDEQRNRLYDGAFRLAHALNYRSLGTVEFLLDSDQNFHFIEVNPRIQVEHPVTEMVTGLDLVKEQLCLAAGQPLHITQDVVSLRGAAIEARVLAEDPEQDFMPATGQISHLKEPGGPGIRIDSALYLGMPVTPEYDSLLAKVIAWCDDRPAAIRRMRRALREFNIAGVATDLTFLQQVIDSPKFVAGEVTTTYLETFTPEEEANQSILERDAAVAAVLYAHRQHELSEQTASSQPSISLASLWRQAAWSEQMTGNA